MSDDPKRSASESPIDWSSSPDPDFKSAPAVNLFAEPAPPIPKPPPVEEEEEEEDEDELEVEVEPDDLFAVEHHHRDPRLEREARLPRKAPGRSPFAVLACLVFGSCLLWLAFQDYQDLGRLHGRAALVAANQRGALRSEHRLVTRALVVNAISGTSFLVGAILLLARRRGLGGFFVLGGIAATIFLLHASLTEGPALRKDELALKLGGIALCAWFRPRASDS